MREGWKEYKMKDIYLGFFDGPHATPKPSDEGPVFLGIKNIKEEGGIDLTTVRHISPSEYPKWTRRVTPGKDDIVFSYEATLHRYAIIPKGFVGCLGRRMALIRLNPSKADVRFIYYYFLSNAWRTFIETIKISGSTVDRISITDFPNYEIQLPPLPLQTRIADLLSAYDELIEVNNRRIALLEQTAEQLYKEWFVRLRFPGYAQTKVRKGVPEGWEEMNFPKAVEINPRIKVDKHKEYTYVDMGSLNENSMITSSHSKRKPKGGAKFTNGDTLFSRITPCLQNGKIGLMQILRKGEVGFGSTEFIIFRSKTLIPEFVYFLSRNQSFRQNAINSMVGASGRQRVDNKCFNSFMFLHPPQSILGQFSDLTNPMVRQIFKLNAQNQTLRRTRDLLLPRLISGQLSVAEAETALNA